MVRRIIALFFSACLCLTTVYAQWQEAKWITVSNGNADAPNTWTSYRCDVVVDKDVPEKVTANICVDSKYWLYLNGKMVVFEGGLKRGPNPTDSYYDVLDLTSHIRKGANKLEVLVWHFGKDGFSHISSGKSGLLFSAPSIGLYSDSKWEARLLPEYGVCGEPVPNFRLSEGSICYDARKELPATQVDVAYTSAKEIGYPGDAPWNALHARPIPLFKDFGLKTVKYVRHQGEKEDTLVARLPYNMQMTPAITLDDKNGGTLIKMQTNHLKGGSEYSVRAEYITKVGKQTYESLGWMNGEELYVILPHGMKIKELRYRESGYDGWAEGVFHSDDEFVNRFWKKALNTLYVNMRDTYYDCPDRERAQWWGDACVLMGECFYTYSTSVHHLMRKAIMELCAFQNEQGIIHSPIPGIYNEELPAQMLSSIGLYGFWNYYMNTGDVETIRTAYPHVRAYLNVWTTDETGLTAERHGGWDWGDWGDHRDIRLIYAAWHYMALDAANRMATLLDKPVEAANYRVIMEKVKKGFNTCWNGTAYRHPGYKGDTDDRVQALAIISGLAAKDKHEQISRLLHTQKHASPYMEKYVLEALFMLGEGEYAMERMRERYGEMVDDPIHTTLYEGWSIGENGFGGGTTNHAWSGGPLTVISQYLMGVRTLEPAWKRFCVEPQTVKFHKASISIPTVKGTIYSAFSKKGSTTTYSLTVPEGTEALLYLPLEDSNSIPGAEKYLCKENGTQKEGKTCLLLAPGKYKFKVKN